MDECLEVQANQRLEPAGMHNCFCESAISPIQTSPTSSSARVRAGPGKALQGRNIEAFRGDVAFLSCSAVSAIVSFSVSARLDYFVGKVIVKDVPSPGELSTWILPPCARMIVWVMTRPSPVPLAFVV